MNQTLIDMKNMRRAMRSYIFLLFEIALESESKNILEIGTGQCQSTRTMLSALKENKGGKLYSIDIGDRSERIPEDLKPYFVQIVGNSHDIEIFNQVKDIEFDLMLIDGDHSYKGVKRDFETYVPLVKEGGIILMHDICNKNEGVKDFWPEIKYPKIALTYGKAAAGIIPGMGIVQKL